MKRLNLTGCKKYAVQAQVFAAVDNPHTVEDELAELLLARKSPRGIHYFRETEEVASKTTSRRVVSSESQGKKEAAINKLNTPGTKGATETAKAPGKGKIKIKTKEAVTIEPGDVGQVGDLLSTDPDTGKSVTV